ncbi:hypothetical protein PG989_006795 [Apiospora arundinis]
MEQSTFYITHRFPCGHSAIYEHPAIVLRKMTRAGLVPRDQEFSQITVHLGTSDRCNMYHGSGAAEKGEAIVLEVESSYCEGCQEAKMREVHESLRALQRDLDLTDDDPADDEQSLRRREDKLRDVFLQLEEAHLTAELAPRHFRGSLRVFVEICVEAIASPGRLRDWMQTLTANDYLVGDVRKAVEERLRRKNQVQ